MSVWVVRHACAGHEGEWDGDDDERPLDPAGVEQAAALALLVALERPTRLLSSPTRRCVDTLVPLGAALGLPIEADDGLRSADGPDIVGRLADDRLDGVVLCTHGEVMQPALDTLRAEGLDVADARTDEDLLLKGAAWRVDRAGPAWRLALLAPLPRTECPRHAGAP